MGIIKKKKKKGRKRQFHCKFSPTLNETLAGKIYRKQLASTRSVLATFKSYFKIPIMSDMIIVMDCYALGRDLFLAFFNKKILRGIITACYFLSTVAVKLVLNFVQTSSNICSISLKIELN